MKVYISGPIARRPLAEARASFESEAKRLTAMGYDSVNPFDVAPHPACSCPDATGNAGAGDGHLWGCYLRGDLAALLDCDVILMLPGWAASHGARLELQVASAVGLQVWMHPIEVITSA